MNKSSIENKIELIEQSRQHMHNVIDEHYNNLINSLKFGMNFSNIKGMVKQLLQDCNSEPKMHYGLVQLADNLYHDGKLLLGSNTEQMIEPIKIDDDLYFECDFEQTKLLDILKDKVFSPIGYDCDMSDIQMNNLNNTEEIIAPNLNL